MKALSAISVAVFFVLTQIHPIAADDVAQIRKILPRVAAMSLSDLEGKVHYVARRHNERWRIEGFMMPANKIHIQLDENDVWVQR